LGEIKFKQFRYHHYDTCFTKPKITTIGLDALKTKRCQQFCAIETGPPCILPAQKWLKH